MMEEEEAVDVAAGRDDYLTGLPPGFRFHPTDDEIIGCYLTAKVVDTNFTAAAIGEADLNKSEPWDLPKKAKMGEKEWYFFCQRDRKYPTGMRTNRATESGYWKATGKDKEIFNERKSLVGMKKTLVFYTGRAPKGEKTNWVMHEYRLHGNFKPPKDEWVVCRVFHKNMGLKKTSPLSPTDQVDAGGQLLRLDSFVGDDFLNSSSSSLPLLMDPTPASHHRPTSLGYGELHLHPADSRALPADMQYYFQLGGSSTHCRQINSFQYPSAAAAAAVDSPQMPTSTTMIYPHQLMIPNPSFSFHPNNDPDYYFQQEIPIRDPRTSIANNRGSPFSFQSSAIDHQAILREIAAAKNNNSHIETSSSSSATIVGLLDNSVQCKLEQHSSNQSMFSVSQDTGLSTADLNNTAEISSSKQEIDSLYAHEDHIESSSVVPFSDIEGLWDY